eukprot:419931_1
MTHSFLLTLSTYFACLYYANGQEQGFDYPDQMPSPFEIVVFNNILYGYVTSANAVETPVVIHVAHIGTTGAWNCVAQYDPNALDVNTKQRPIVTELPSTQYLTSQTRSLCLQHVYVKIMNAFYKPMVPYYFGLFTLWGLQNINPEIDQRVIDCNGNTECLTQLSIENNFYPSFMANIVAYEIIKYFRNDGWNSDGSMNSLGKCTANCRKYTDTTGYKPKLLKKNAVKSDGKTCTKNDQWIPLLESDGYGFFFRHEHVTPHIGITAKPFLFDEFKKAQPPNYNYDHEMELTLERLRLLAVNDTMKMNVEFYDNKLIVRGMIGLALLRQYPDTMTYENFINYIIGISLTEHDTLLTSWNQKIKYDKIRPTTVVQRKGNQLITTYGGPYQGIKTFEAKDFEPYIRVMPHSEYPSASACLCTGYAEFTKDFVKQEYNDDNLHNIHWFEPAGSSNVEPDITPKEDLLLYIGDLDDMYEICSKSRLWGGMHFTASVHSGKEICTGIGTLAYEYALRLKENSNFLGQTYLNESRTDITDVLTTLVFIAGLSYLDQSFDFNDLLSGNPEFTPVVVLFLQGFIPSIQADNAYDLWIQIIAILKVVSGNAAVDGTTEANAAVVKIDNMIEYNNNNHYDDNIKYKGLLFQNVNINIISLIFIMVISCLLFLCVGICIGNRFKHTSKYHCDSA